MEGPTNEHKWLILYHNGEWEYRDLDTIEEVINYLKYEDRYSNYGHKGATIFAWPIVKYTISDKPNEIRFC